MNFVLATLAGALVGFLLGRFFAGRGAAAPVSGQEIENELRRRLEEQQRQLAAAGEREMKLVAEKARAESDKAAAEARIAEQGRLHEKSLGELRVAQEKSLEEMKTAFRALSADALRQSAPDFVRLASEQFAKLQEAAKGDLGQRQEAIKGLLKPLEEQLKTYQERLQQTESSQSKILGEVQNQLMSLTQRSESLARETEQFRMVLKSNQSRGRWGEETLRRVVETAGMSPFCDFVEQVSEDDSRPDMIIRLPGERVIIVDSKVPDIDFLAALEAADPAARKEALREHSRKLRKTIGDLSKKNYPAKHLNSMDYVVLFLPAESLFSAALEGDNDLIIAAAEAKVMLATPSSLIGLLRAISLSWDQMKQTENTRHIKETAEELYERILTFVGHFERIRDGIATANDSLNKAIGSYQSRVKPSGQKLLAYGIKGKELPDLDQIATDLRRIEG